MELGVPFTAVTGFDDGPLALVISGIHGCEIGAISAARLLASRLLPEDINGSVVIIRIANPDGFFARTEYINPTDGLNLNYCFPGDPDGSVSYRIGHAITGIMKNSDLVVDLHSGDLSEDLYPFAVIPPGGQKEKNLAAARALGFDYFVGISGHNMPTDCAAGLGIPAVMAEMDSPDNRSETFAGDYCARVINCLRSFGVLKGRADDGTGSELSSYVSIKSEENGYWIPTVKPGEMIKKGDLIGHTEDLFGCVLQRYYAGQNGVVLYIVRTGAVKKAGSLYAMGLL